MTDIECGGGFYVRSLVDDLGKGEIISIYFSSLMTMFIKKLIQWTKQSEITLQTTKHENNQCLWSAALSSCAHVKELIRTKQGQFTLEEHALQEEQWTLEHILRSLQPCSESHQGAHCTQPLEADTWGLHSVQHPNWKWQAWFAACFMISQTHLLDFSN